MSVDGLGNPLRFSLTGGQVHDISQAAQLIDGLQGEYVIADRAYDSTPFIDQITPSGAIAVIPARSNRRQPRTDDAHLYRERHLVERFIGKIKHYRRIFARFEKSATRYMSFLHFVSTFLWLRCNGNTT